MNLIGIIVIIIIRDGFSYFISLLGIVLDKIIYIIINPPIIVIAIIIEIKLLFVDIKINIQAIIIFVINFQVILVGLGFFIDIMFAAMMIIISIDVLILFFIITSIISQELVYLKFYLWVIKNFLEYFSFF